MLTMKERLSDLRTVVRELKATYRRKWPEPETYRKRDRLRKKVIKLHTALFKFAVFPDDVWSVERFKDSTSWSFKVEISLRWPKTGDGWILREAHKAVATLSTPLRLYPESNMYVESTSYCINAVLQSNAALTRFIARHKITLDPTPVVASHTRQINECNLWIQRIQKVTKRLNRLSAK